MVTWSKAFSSAIKIIVYSIGFWIIGAILIGFGMSQATALAMAYPARYYINLVIGILSTLSGVILIALGGFASLLKVFTELIISEIKNPKEMVQTNPLCKRCGREYPIGSKYCSNCGSELS